MDDQKYLRLAAHTKSLERAHRDCKRNRYNRVIRELESLRDNENFNLPRAAYDYIEDRLEELKRKYIQKK